jgi:hypothetical protein
LRREARAHTHNIAKKAKRAPNSAVTAVPRRSKRKRRKVTEIRWPRAVSQLYFCGAPRPLRPWHLSTCFVRWNPPKRTLLRPGYGGYPPRIHPQVYTRGFLRKRVTPSQFDFITHRREPVLAGTSRSGFRPTGILKVATGLPVGLTLRHRAADILPPRRGNPSPVCQSFKNRLFLSPWNAWKNLMKLAGENLCFQVWRTSKKIQIMGFCDSAEGRRINKGRRHLRLRGKRTPRIRTWDSTRL